MPLSCSSHFIHFLIVWFIIFQNNSKLVLTLTNSVTGWPVTNQNAYKSAILPLSVLISKSLAFRGEDNLNKPILQRKLLWDILELTYHR